MGAGRDLNQLFRFEENCVEINNKLDASRGCTVSKDAYNCKFNKKFSALFGMS